MKNVFNIALATLGAVAAEGYDYKDLGDNWKKDGNVCETGKNQSPINLISEDNKKGFKDAAYKMYDGSADQFTKIYENPW